MGWIRQDGLVCCSLVEQIGRELGLAVDFLRSRCSGVAYLSTVPDDPSRRALTLILKAAGKNASEVSDSRPPAIQVNSERT